MFSYFGVRLFRPFLFGKASLVFIRIPLLSSRHSLPAKFKDNKLLSDKHHKAFGFLSAGAWGHVFKRADSSPAQTTFPAFLISFYDTTVTSRERQRAVANLLSPDTQTLL